MVASVTAEKVGDGCDLVRLHGIGVVAAGSSNGGGLEGFVAEESLVDHIEAVTEGICFMRCRRKQ